MDRCFDGPPDGVQNGYYLLWHEDGGVTVLGRRFLRRSLVMQRVLAFALLAGLFGPAVDAEDNQEAQRLTVATRRYGGSDLITVDVTSKEVTRLTKDMGDVNEPCWHPGGERMAVVVTTNGAGSIKLFNTSTAEVQAVGQGPNDRGPSWSPDGKKLLFTGDANGGPDLFVMDADGKNIVNLTNAPGWDSDGAWSPDGNKIAFTSNRAGAFRLYVMNLDGTQQTDLLNQDLIYSVYPCWSPDGEQLAFGGRGSDGAIQLCVVNADGQGLQQLSDAGQLNSHAAWSPDGQYIAYVRFNTKRVGNNALGKGDLMLYDCIAATHTTLLSDELPIVGPRPTWKPTAKAP
jgi:Tol biopolymer transport system component